MSTESDAARLMAGQVCCVLLVPLLTAALTKCRVRLSGIDLGVTDSRVFHRGRDLQRWHDQLRGVPGALG